MTSGRSQAGQATRRRSVAVWGAVIGACAVCCAGPLLAVLAAVGVTAGIAAVALPALALVAGAAFLGVWWLRRRARARCTAPSRLSGPADLGLPAVGVPAESSGSHRSAP